RLRPGPQIVSLCKVVVERRNIARRLSPRTSVSLSATIFARDGKKERAPLNMDPIKLPNESRVPILTVLSSGIHSLHPAGGQLVISWFTITVVLPKPKKKEEGSSEIFL
ncbi:unnamed protein product, partial [Ectocarpus sp. 13 AM-2016]